ncbi:MAG: hypothetical protein Kow00121_58910 [Elainellaceae cyanobacterium]
MNVLFQFSSVWIAAVRQLEGRSHSICQNSVYQSLVCHWRRICLSLALSLIMGLSSLTVFCAPALASLNDDHYDGNIFALYAGNGSIFPPRVNLAESMQRDKPIVLVLFTEDSSDCKLFSSTVSQLDAFYGRAANIVPVNVDAIPPRDRYQPTEPGYYYKGLVPQTVVFDQSHKVVLDEVGMVPYEQVDDVLREVFDLLPRSESLELKRRAFNEFSGELVE